MRVEVTLLAPAERHWVVLEDMVPAGLEPINFNLASAPQHLQDLLDQGDRPEEYFRLYWYEHREIRPDRVAVFARHLPEGAYTFSIWPGRDTGNFSAPAQGREMSCPETSGRGEGLTLVIELNRSCAGFRAAPPGRR